VRIAIIAPLVTTIREPQLGGSQSLVADFAAGLTVRGHEVHVYAATGSEIPGVKVIDTGIDPAALRESLYRADSPRQSDGQSAEEAFARVYAAVRGVSYDLVHNHAFDAPAIKLATALEVPVVHTLHLPPDQSVAAALQAARLSERSPTVAAVSASQADAWRVLTRVDVVLPNGVPTARIPWSESAGSGAVFAGRLSPEKGAAEALDIAKAAGVHVDLYGNPYDLTYAEGHIYPRRGEPGVAVHSAVERTVLWEIIARASVVLCPAKWEEPFGMVAAEAQAAGTPVVAFRRGGLREVIVDGLTGFLVAPDDIVAAAEAVGKAAGISRSTCRRHAETHLNLEASLDMHEELYRRVTQSMKATTRA
jgi:glycosyltransferase involved in cell wall biosynthesis